MLLHGRIVGYKDGDLLIRAKLDTPWIIERQKIKGCEIRLDDGRTISNDQRRKIHATLGDIALFTGHVKDDIEALSKYDFISRTGSEYFSLSDCSITKANEFLDYLIDFCIETGIATSEHLIDRAPDIGRYLYSCLAHKRCCITGGEAELHHVDAVGMGRDREDIIHQGMRVLPLNREKHTEAHTLGGDSFCAKYHVHGIKLDAELCRVWNVKGDPNAE